MMPRQRISAREAHEEDSQLDSKRKLLQMSEISLWLDNYDDIFSDFDPRPYSQRALSDDFLFEAKKASRDKVEEALELKFLVPKKRRNSYEENLIKKRLHEHFRKHYSSIQRDVHSLVQQGTIFAVFGVILMFVTTYLLFHYGEKNFLISFLIVLLEPAGWFLFWEGLDLVIFEPKELRGDLAFYRKMSQCVVEFLGY